MSSTIEILETLATGKLSAAGASAALRRIEEVAARQEALAEEARVAGIRRAERAASGRLAIAARGLPACNPRGRGVVSPIVSDREIIHAVARGWVVPAKAVELL
jgi:hypothetical protein